LGRIQILSRSCQQRPVDCSSSPSEQGVQLSKRNAATYCPTVLQARDFLKRLLQAIAKI
jgi:hypothetical protein